MFLLQVKGVGCVENDAALLIALRRMDDDALVQVFDMYAPALFNYAIRMCNDPMMADQIVGDVFAKLLEQLSLGKGPLSNLRSYLFQTTHHILVDQVRYSRYRLPLEIVDALPAIRQSTTLDLENRILMEKVSQAMQVELTDCQRHVIILRFIEGFSLRETADILGKSINIVKAAQDRAMITLRKSLDQWVVPSSPSSLPSTRPSKR